jgi:hypothetical protein
MSGQFLKKQAKAISIAVWTYFAEHPTVDRKSRLPIKLRKAIRFYWNKCPLCDWYWFEEPRCNGCPLGSCTESGSAFNRWAEPSKYNPDNTIAIRRRAAEEILAKIEAWEV